MTEGQNADTNKNNIQMGLIVALLVIIAVMGFFLGKNSATDNVVTNNTTGNNTGTDTVNEDKDYDTLTIKVIDDKRCTNCPTGAVLEQLKQLPSISGVEVEMKDFSDEGVEEYLKENNINSLPLIVFSTNNFDVSKDPVQTDPSGKPVPKVNTFLVSITSGEYILEIGAQFNPFEKRSENGFLLLDKEKLEAIKSNSYIKGNSDAKITWLEYSDLECPYCAKLHNAGTEDELTEKYGDDLNIIFNHFPLAFHDNAQDGAEILECLAEQKGSDAYYALIKKAFADEKSSKSYLIDEAVALGASEDDIEECLDDGKHTDNVKNQMKVGGEMFGITGTPGNVIINNETGEYEILSGAYPTEAFEEIVEKLLK